MQQTHNLILLHYDTQLGLRRYDGVRYPPVVLVVEFANIHVRF